MTYAGADFAAFAIEVATTSAGSVTGYGAVATSPSPPYVFVSVSGSTDPTNISLALTDLFNDTMFMSGTLQGQVFRGTWSFPALGLGGGFRMTSEENIGLLALDSLPPASFFDLFHQPKSP